MTLDLRGNKPSNLRGTLDHETIGRLLDALGQAYTNVRDIERIISDPRAARAALLASRNVRAPANQKPIPVKLTSSEIAAVLKCAPVPDEFAKKYSTRAAFSRLVAGTRITQRGLEMVAMNLGVYRFSRQYTLVEIGERYGVTKERVRQIIFRTRAELRQLAESERPLIIDQVTEGKLSAEQRELLELLG